MSTKLVARTAGAAATLTIAAGFAVSCTQAKQTGNNLASSATSVATAASGAVSSVMAGPPTTMNVPGVGEVALDEAIAAKYRQMGGEAILGLPTGQPSNAGNGTVQPFAKGTIYSSPSTGPHVVRGDILNIYLAQGGPTNPLGFPTTDEYEVCGGPNVAHGGWGTEFEHGYIWWLNWGDEKHTFAGYITGKDRSPGLECGR